MKHIQGIIFDYGNTLVEFAEAQITACDSALAAALTDIYGPHDRAKLREIRDRNRMAPYMGDPPQYIENNLRVITADLVRELYGVEPSEEDLQRLLQVRYDSSFEQIRASDGTASFLERLSTRYPLGLLSNYPDGGVIRASLHKVGFAPYFHSVVVSGDVGYAKPHPLLFKTIAEKMAIEPGALLFVGDNWLADVQGAKRAGMSAALTTQWRSYEVFDRNPGDFEPDLVVASVTEIERCL